MKTICYHGRDASGIKIFGGMLHANTLTEAAERATSGFSVHLTASGRPIWKRDKDGKEVAIYLSICPEHTERGRAGHAAALKARDIETEERARLAREKTAALENLINGLGEEKALAILQRFSEID